MCLCCFGLFMDIVKSLISALLQVWVIGFTLLLILNCFTFPNNALVLPTTLHQFSNIL